MSLNASVLTILRYIKLIPLLAIGERGHGNRCTLFAPARIIPLMKESLHTCASLSIPMLIPSNNISNETRHPLADRSSVLVKFVQSIPRGGDSATVPHKRGQIIVVPAIIEHSHLINRVRIADSSRVASGRGNYSGDYHRATPPRALRKRRISQFAVTGTTFTPEINVELEWSRSRARTGNNRIGPRLSWKVHSIITRVSLTLATKCYCQS